MPTEPEPFTVMPSEIPSNFVSNESFELKSIGQPVHVRASGSGNAVMGVWEISPQRKQNMKLHLLFPSQHLMRKVAFAIQF